MSDSSTSPTLKPGEVLGPDGKPCKVCTGFKHWTRGATKKQTSAGTGTGTASLATATATATAAEAEAAPSSPSPSSLGSDCPPDVERLGRHTWTFLHTAASYFPPTPSLHQQSSMVALLRSLPTLYPCGTCATHLGEYLERDPPEKHVETRQGVERWMCRAHNEVNERLGKPKFDCDTVGERWRDGPKDGHCD